MVEIAHGEIVEGSRGKRHRLYGTYTDPATKKIHKANSFVSKDKYDKAVAEMTAGMPVADIAITQVSIFAEDSPVSAEPSELGGPTEPDNAGVPADVGGDESVPMGDEPSDIDAFEAEKKNCGCGKDPCITYGADVGTTIDDIIMDEYVDEGEALEDAEDYSRKARQALNELGAEEADLTGIIVQDNDPSSPPEGIFASDEGAASVGDDCPTCNEEIEEVAICSSCDARSCMQCRDSGDWSYDANLVGNDTSGDVCGNCISKSGPEPGTWAAIALDMALSGDMTSEEANRWKDEMKEKGFDAEMTLREWGESELKEEKHDFSENPNESFREWIDEEVKGTRRYFFQRLG